MTGGLEPEPQPVLDRRQVVIHSPLPTPEAAVRLRRRLAAASTDGQGPLAIHGEVAPDGSVVIWARTTHWSFAESRELRGQLVERPGGSELRATVAASSGLSPDILTLAFGIAALFTLGTAFAAISRIVAGEAGGAARAAGTVGLLTVLLVAVIATGYVRLRTSQPVGEQLLAWVAETLEAEAGTR